MRTIHRPVAAALVCSVDDRIIMGRKYAETNGVYPDLWGLPGGVKELGETLEETARRETLEETGVDLSGNKVVLVDDQGYDLVKFLLNSGETVLLSMPFSVFMFKMLQPHLEISLRRSEEHAQLAWVPKGAIAEYDLCPPLISLSQRLGCLSVINART